MKNIRRIVLVVITLFSLISVFAPYSKQHIKADDAPEIKQRELKAVWISAFVGEMSYTSEAQFKNQMYEMFDVLEYYGYNAIIYHIRTHNNAFYKSDINPLASWFKYVDFDVFDPLEWVIEESHKRGIEFHAWLNPYRIDDSRIVGSYPEANPANDEANLMTNGSATILNPALEVVRQHIYDTIIEIVENYNVDAIHFDDYFYISGTGSYQPSNADGRREQVDILIEGISSRLKAFNNQNNRAVQFGISPSGIYKNGNGEIFYTEDGFPISSGSESRGFAHYGDYLYADTIKWAFEGWIDYLIPQVYWSQDRDAAPYTLISDWWNRAFKYLDVNLYNGLGVYMADGNGYGWSTNMYELDEQLTILDGFENYDGYSIFSYKHLVNGYKNSSLLSGVQINNAYNEQRKMIKILPEIKSMEPVNIPNITNLKLQEGILSWDSVEGGKFYYIYKAEELTYDESEIVGVIGHYDGVMNYNTNDLSGNYQYGVRAISRTNHLNGLPKLAEQVLESTNIGLREKDGKIKEGLIFNAKVSQEYKDNERGFYVMYGEVLLSELISLLNNNTNNQELFINGKKVFKEQINEITEENEFSVIVTGIPEHGYFDKITVIPYIVDNNKLIFPNKVTTTSFIEVLINLIKEDPNNQYLNNIYDNLTSKYKYYLIEENLITLTSNFINVDFDNKEGSFIKAGKSITLPTKLGYDSTYYDGSNYFNEQEYIVLELDINIEISYSLTQYNVYLYDGETLVDTLIFTKEDEVNLPIISKEGFLFEGWYNSINYTGEEISKIETNTTSNINLYVKWRTDDGQYNIFYNLDGGSFAYSTRESMAEAFIIDFYNYLNPVESLSDFMHGVGNSVGFDGIWHSKYVDRVYDGLRPTEIDEAFFISSSMYMDKWLTFFDMMERFVNEVNANQTFYQIPTPEDYLVAGRVRIRQYLNNIKPANFVSNSTMAMMPTPLVTFEAVSSYNKNIDPIILPIPHKEGYTFGGWYLEENFINRVITTENKEGHLILYAKWI